MTRRAALLFILLCVLALYSFTLNEPDVQTKIVKVQHYEFKDGKAKTLYLKIAGNICGGAAVREDALLTATHCLTEGADMGIAMSDGTKVIIAFNDIIGRLDDGKDHTLIRFSSHVFDASRVLKIRSGFFQETEKFHLWGAPGGWAWTFREGRVAGIDKAGARLDCRCFMGDSGTPILDAQGRLVGLLNEAWQATKIYGDGLFHVQFGISIPFNFKQEEVNALLK